MEILLIIISIIIGWFLKWLVAKIQLGNALKKSSNILKNKLKEAEIESVEILKDGSKQNQIEREYLKQELKERLETISELENQINQKK